MSPPHPNPLVAHHGPLTEAQANAVYGRVRAEVEAGRAPRTLVSATIELVQNLRLHGAQDARVALTIAGDDSAWTLETRNPASPADAARALAAAEAANATPTGALRERIRALRAAPRDPASPGAGIGLHELRRLASSALEVKVLPPEAPEGKSVLVIRVHLIKKQPRG